MSLIENIKLAKKLNEELNTRKDNLILRGNPNSISLVSLDLANAEMGISNINPDKIHSNYEKYKNKIKQKIAGRKTPEKDLQAWIIKHAINNNNILPFGNNWGYLTSELALFKNNGEKVVCDILAIKENELFVIELKSERLLTQLLKQVDDFEDIFREQHQTFIDLVRLFNYKISELNLNKVIVWKDTPKQDVFKKEFSDKNVIEVCYTGSYEEGFSFRTNQ